MEFIGVELACGAELAAPVEKQIARWAGDAVERERRATAVGRRRHGEGGRRAAALGRSGDATVKNAEVARWSAVAARPWRAF